MINRIVHMNVVVTDIEKSLKFYCDPLGGHVVGGAEKESIIKSIINRKTESRGAGIALGLGETTEWKACLIRFSYNKEATVIDLLQWIKPASTGRPYEKLNNVGIAWMALAADDVGKTYDDLEAKGVAFISPTQEVDLSLETPGQGLIKIAVCKDPDGTAVEFVEFIQP